MIHYERFELSNGLKVLFHKDIDTPIAAVNLLYNVGARDEHPDKTGFAHLFEHLMFGGSVNIPDFDTPLQMVGGENNAFTNNDYTNYYIVLPKDNLETALWLESDRMLSLAFSKKSLKVQKNVVIEEFKQRYLNQPYGDIWLYLRPLAYKIHPYMWSTIGKEISHIENATIEDVKEFFFQHYAPNNAILTVAGNFEIEYVREMVEKWFGGIERREVKLRNIPQEPLQTEKRTLTLERDVPYNAIYKTYHIGGRNDNDYYVFDLLSDVLSSGKSSRLYQKLVKEVNIFSNVDAYISGDIEPGLFVFSGNLMEGVSMETAEKAIDDEIQAICTKMVSEYEFEKVKNKMESNWVFSEMHILNKAMNLGFYELIGDAELINSEIDKYRAVTREDLLQAASKTFIDTNCSVLYYLANPVQTS